MIKIDVGIPMPDRKKYPLRRMDLGDSFFVPGMKQNRISGNFPRLAPKKFATRAVTENGVSGIRVWRVA